MKVKLLTTFLVLAVVSTSPIVFSTPASSATPAPKTLKLLWSDEFSAKKVSLPNPKNWDFDIGNSYGWGNSELEYYTNKTSNVAQDGKGHLIITANRISDAAGTQVGTAAGTPQILNICYECQFTSAKLKTANRLGFKYGRIEARMKLPSGLGTWPAFWMLGADLLEGNGWPECGEIDVLEARGDLPPVAYGTLLDPILATGVGMEIPSPARTHWLRLTMSTRSNGRRIESICMSTTICTFRLPPPMWRQGDGSSITSSF